MRALSRTGSHRVVPATPSVGPLDGILGIDEAGRGSVFGPLVVAGFRLAPESLPALVELGVRDSKALTPARRTELDGKLRGLGRAFVRTVAPSRIDARVRRRGLNALEAEVFAEIVRDARPTTAFVDACDPVAARFGHTVARLAERPRKDVVARHHADRDLPIVAAASIVAKVARDRALARLALATKLPVGTGYPGDPETRACLARLLAAGGPLPKWVRSSWATVRNLKPDAPARPIESFG